MDGPVPDYYGTLGVDPSSSADDIRQAYKRESLRAHPDRFPNASSSERQRYTARFQSLADAYYVLSDSTRRAEYDSLRRAHGVGTSSHTSAGNASSSNVPPGGWEQDAEKEQESSFRFFRNFFSHTAGADASSSSSSNTGNAQPQANYVFSDVFEELLRPEVQRVAPVWKWVGSASGAGLGFILANVPGMIGGAVLGNRLGAIRDAKGKSVAEVFGRLSSNQRAEVLKALAVKILGAVG